MRHSFSRGAAATRLSSAAIAAIVLAGCGGDEPTRPTPPPAAPMEESSGESASDAPSQGLAAPGSRMGLGAGGDSAPADDASGGEGGGDGGGDAASVETEPAARTSGAAPIPSTPAPPGAPIAVPPPKDTVDQVYSNAKDLERDAAAAKFSEFRNLASQNTEMMVKVARARAAMKTGGAAEQEAYVKINLQYAEFSERLNDYMAQRRWSDRDREAMGYLLSRSTEEAMRRVQSGS